MRGATRAGDADKIKKLMVSEEENPPHLPDLGGPQGQKEEAPGVDFYTSALGPPSIAATTAKAYWTTLEECEIGVVQWVYLAPTEHPNHLQPRGGALDSLKAVSRVSGLPG